MALTKVITGVTDLNQDDSTNGLKFPTGSVFAGTPEEGMIRNDQSQSSETSSSTMQFYNGTAWKNFVNKTPIPLGSDNFNTVLYTGNSSTQAITGVGFAPDFVWIKRRNSAEDHALYDSVRGTNEQLSSNTTAAQATNSSPYLGLTSFDSDGFTSGNNGGTNRSPNTYVAWSWKAGGAAVSNTDGTITSQVSANVDAGFSVVKYTGNGNTSRQSYGHGLSSAPELLINKNIDTATQGTNSWVVGGTLLGNGGYIFLNSTSAKNTASSYNGNKVPDSEVIYTSGTSDLVGNQNGINFITYAFHSVAGYSKIGSYTGNGSSTGPVVDTGFEPAWVMIKSSSSDDGGGGAWLIYDNKRSTSNPRNKRLYANYNYAELTSSSYDLDFLSNGFQPKSGTSSYGFNTLGVEYIYMAFAAT